MKKAALDQAEGLGASYSERQVEVVFNGGTAIASLYYATAFDPTLKPYTWYKELVIAGARQHSLPPEYIRALEGEAAIEDANRARHAKIWPCSKQADERETLTIKLSMMRHGRTSTCLRLITRPTRLRR